MHSAAIAVFCLPPDLPWLNLDEHLERDFKLEVYTVMLAPGQATQLRKVLGHLSRIRYLRPRVVAYFEHPAIR